MNIACQQGYKVPNTPITQTKTQVHICLLTYHAGYIHMFFQMFSYISEKSSKRGNNFFFFLIDKCSNNFRNEFDD